MKPKNVFVAFFDILGFRSAREKKGTADLYQSYLRGVLPAIQHSAAGIGKTVLRNGQSVHIPDFSDISCDYIHVSDSVILFTQSDDFYSFLKIVNSSYYLLRMGFAGGKMPFRGAIGYGDLIHDKARNIFLGSAIENAYEGEQSQVWAGCRLTSKCMEFIEQEKYMQIFKDFYEERAKQKSDNYEANHILQEGKRLVQYDYIPLQKKCNTSPTKYDNEKGYVIDWTIQMYDGATSHSFYETQKTHAQKIIDNTEAFEKWARKNNRIT